MSLYLGLDSSTQSLSAIVLEVDGDRRRVAFESSIAFDETFPQYGTRHGVLPSDDPTTATSPPLLWVEALELMMRRLQASGLDLGQVAAISGSAQQHGSVYLNDRAADASGSFDQSRPLAEQVEPLLSRDGGADLDGLEHVAECARDRESRGWRSRARRAHRVARVRALHCRTDSEVLETRPDHLRVDGSHPSGQLVSRIAPHRPARAARSWRWIGNEPDGPRVLPMVAAGAWTRPPLISRRNFRRSPARRLDRHPLHVLAVTFRTAAGEGGRVVGRQPVQPRRRRPGARGTTGGLARHERHRLRSYARAARRSPRHRSCVRCANRRLHGVDLFQERIARARTHPRRVRDVRGRRSRERCIARRRETPGAIMLPWFEPEITPTVLDAWRPALWARSRGRRRQRARGRRSAADGDGAPFAMDERQGGTIYATGGAAANRDILQVMADVFGAVVYQLEVGNSAASRRGASGRSTARPPRRDVPCPGKTSLSGFGRTASPISAAESPEAREAAMRADKRSL